MSIRVTIRTRDRTIVFPVSERERVRELLKEKLWWDRRSNRWAGRGDLTEIQRILEEAGYTVKML